MEGMGPRSILQIANLIRIVQRFLLGVDLRLDGSLSLAPTAPAEFWKRGFGQRLAWRDRVLDYRMKRGRFTGRYSGGMQEIMVRLDTVYSGRVKVNGKTTTSETDGQMIRLTLPASAESKPCRFEVR